MWWSIGIPVVAGALYLARGLARKQRRLKRWQEAMALCRVTEVESSGFGAWRAKLTARSGSTEVRITDARGNSDWAEVVIEGPEGFSVMKLRRQTRKLRTREIEVGDEDFDDAYLVDGPIRPVHARLNATVRRQLVRASAVCGPLEIGGGQLRADVSDEMLPRALPLLLAMSRQLAKPVDVEQRIAENARRDPEAGVRIVNLLLLVRERPDDPDTLQVLRSACSDTSPKVRLRAAIELGEEGHNVLLELAEDRQDDASSAQAVAQLGGKLPLERVRTILFRALEKGRLQTTVRACLEVLGHRGAAAVDALEKVMTRQKGELAAAAALALGTTGEAAAEPPLLQALQSEHSDLREAAVTALGRVGTAAAVQPLQEAAERSLFDLDLRRAARQAIAEIQSRLQGASPGQLSLAETEAGQLSLAPFEAGQLSLAPTEAKQTPDRPV